MEAVRDVDNLGSLRPLSDAEVHCFIRLASASSYSSIFTGHYSSLVALRIPTIALRSRELCSSDSGAAVRMLDVRKMSESAWFSSSCLSHVQGHTLYPATTARFLGCLGLDGRPDPIQY